MDNLKNKLFKFGKLFYPIIIVVLCVIILLVVYLLIEKQSSLGVEKISNNNVSEEDSRNNEVALGDDENIFLDKITGEKEENETFSYPIAVAMDNHMDAYPLFGIEEAKLVYEAPVEGGLTRLLAFYTSDQKVDKIGPVRSARGYFLDWLKPFDALFIHCGGSPESLVRIIDEDFFDFNEFSKTNYFWRDKNKSAPHNVMTDLYKIKEYIASNREEVVFSSWKFVDDDVKNDDDIENSVIAIKYLIKENEVEWNYDSEKGLYIRNMTGKDFNEIISAKTIIIQEVETTVVDEKLRLSMETVGEGDAVICSNGNCKKANWKKENSLERVKYYYGNKEVEFNPGKFWVEIVDQEVDYSY